ncbi:MAG: S1C family serine protease, partial [Vulcanimicrobiaceae bacterium]
MSSPTASALAALSDDLAQAVANAAPSVAYLDANPRRDLSAIAWDAHHLITTDHLVESDESAAFRFEGAPLQARLVARDPATDVALFRTEATLTPLARADLSALAVGRFVLALARDEDGALGATFGIISSLDGAWRTWRGGEIERFIRPDLNFYRGFSGGPLVDSAGQLIGMNTAGLSRRSALTIPLETLERVVAVLASGRSPRRGYLGVALQAIEL